jgi:plastocyanin
MRQRLGFAGMGIGSALVVVSVVLVGCGDSDVKEGARERLTSVGAAPPGESASAGGGSAGAEDLEDVVVVDGAVAEVDVRDNTFDAENIQVASGTRVVWTNNGRQDHDILPAEENGAGGDWGVEPADFTPDAVYERTFDEPGTYRYYCSLHGTAEAGMTGAIVVTE